MPLSTSRSVPAGISTAAKALPAIDRGARLGKRAGANRDAQCSARIQRLDDPAAEIAQIVVDDRDGKLAKDLVQIGLRIIDAVDQRSQEQQAEGAPRSEHAPPLRREGAADAARCAARSSVGSAGRAVVKPALALEARHAQQCEAGKEHGQARERGEGNGANSETGNPRAACPSKTAMYQRSGRIALQTCANAFMPTVGKPTPA